MVYMPGSIKILEKSGGKLIEHVMNFMNNYQMYPSSNDKLILSSVIGPEQSSFVPGKQIVDNVIVYHEAMHSMRRLLHTWRT